MAETTVSFLVDKLTPLILEQAKQLGGLREEIEYIKDELDQMKAFLRVAEAREEINNDQQVKVWVNQVRNVAFQIEDVLDIFMLRLGHNHGKGICGFLRKVACCIKTLRARHRLSSQVISIKSRVNDISEMHGRYCKQFSILEQGSSSTSAPHVSYDYRGDALLLEEAELVGIDKPKLQLMDWLLDKDHQLKVISIAGMGGLGKTTLTKRVYEDEMVKTHFQCHAWLTVSESFKLDELLKGLIKQLFEEAKKPIPPEVDNMDLNNLKSEINTFLREKRYVLVLDDVWNIRAWKAITLSFPDCKCGSRILLTTRKINMASQCSKHVYNLEPLPFEVSWTLLCRKTFGKESCPHHLVEILISILKRCGGLPLAIVVIGGLLSTKDPKQVEQWERMNTHLGVELEEDDIAQSINKILSLSYTELPYHLKLCFLYLSIFPEDSLLEHWRLIRLWVAEGFVMEKDGLTLEEVAEGYLNELVNRSLVQVAKKRREGRVQFYQIHDLWREIVIKRAEEQSIVEIIKDQRSWSYKVRRLSIHTDLENIEEGEGLTRLRSLFLFGQANSTSMQQKIESLLGESRLLKILDLRNMPMEIFPDEIGKLCHLRYLSLRGTKIRIIPRSIGELQYLESLDLKGTLVTTLPDDILKLHRLRHLLLYRYSVGRTYKSFSESYIGFKAPPEIGNMSSLQKLCSIEVNDNSGNIVLQELGKLTHLRRLYILKVRSEDGRNLCMSLNKLSNLHSLVVTSNQEDDIIDLDCLSTPPQLLRALDLRGCLKNLPYWIPSLYRLQRITLRFTNLTDDDPLQALQGLPNLVQLCLDLAYEGEELYFKAEGFQRLKYLFLIRLKGLRIVRMEKGTMPYLEQLTMRDLELEELPLGFEHLTNLKYAEFGDMPLKFISRVSPQPRGEDYWKIEKGPHVWIGDSGSGNWEGYFISSLCHN